MVMCSHWANASFGMLSLPRHFMERTFTPVRRRKMKLGLKIATAVTGGAGGQGLGSRRTTDECDELEPLYSSWGDMVAGRAARPEVGD